MSSVAVIGAGITGLVAALELAERNIPVTLYEASCRVGGVIGSIHKNGFIVETGPNTLLETAPYYKELISKIGLDTERLYSAAEASNRYIAKGGKLVPVPASPPQFLKSELFSLSAKLRLFREPFVGRAPAHVEESVAQFVLRRLGREFLDYAINPMIAGIYAGDPHRLSVREGFPRLYSLEQEHRSLLIGQFARGRELRAKGEVSKQDAPKLSFTAGLQAVPDAIARKLVDRVQLGSKIHDITKTEGGWRLSFDQAGAPLHVTHSAALLAIPAHQAAQVWIDAGPHLSLAPLGEIVYAPVTTLALGFQRGDVRHPLDGFGVLIPEKENLSILGCIFSSSLFPNRAPAGHVLVTCYIGGMRAPKLSALSQEEQVQLALKDLTTLLGLAGPPVFTHRTVFQNGIPQYELGYARYRKVIYDVETRCPGIFLGGNYRDGIALGDSILNGRNFAARIAEHLAAQAAGNSAPAPASQPLST